MGSSQDINSAGIGEKPPELEPALLEIERCDEVETPAEPEPLPTRLLGEGELGGLVYEPRVALLSDHFVRIVGKREARGRIPWGFWGGLLVLMVLVFLVTGARYVYEIWDILWALTALTIGVAMFRFGRRSTLEQQTLCEVDLREQRIVWPGFSSAGAAPTRADQLSLHFEDLSEVVFAMTDYPLSARKNDVRVDAFTLLVRDRFERLIPVIEATPNKNEAHQIAKILGGQLGLPISYVGKGFQ